jgi:hypothetical protein
MLSRAAARGLKLTIPSIWKLDSSTTKTRPGAPSTRPISGTPMLPQTSTGMPAARTMAPVRAVVVLLPLLPVMATIGPWTIG